MPYRNQYQSSAGSATNKRKTYSPQFKLDRAIEAHRTNNLSEISRKYGINPNVISKWRAQVKDHGAKIFETVPDQQIAVLKNKITKLEQMLGKKEVELNLLKNFSDFYESQNTT